MSERGMGYNPEAEIFRMPKHEMKQPSPEADDDIPDMNFSRALGNFENAMIDRVNEGLEFSDENKIISSNGRAQLEWLVDEETPEGHFAIIQREGSEESEAAGEYVELVDQKTGEKYMEKKLSGKFESPKDKAVTYYLKTEQVREVFNKLKSEIKKSFIDGLKENMEASARLLVALNTKLKNEKRLEQKKELETEIAEQELAQENLNKEFKALT